MKEVFFQGKFVPFAEAKVGVMTHALNYGTGCFEGIRGYYSPEDKTMYVLQLADHFARMQHSAKILRMKLPYALEKLVSLTVELVKRNPYQEDIYIRPLLYKSSEYIGVKLHDLEDDLAIYISPFGAYLDTSAGIKTCVSSWRRVDDNAIPIRAKVTGLYINSAFAKTEAHDQGCAEAIMLNSDGYVSEGSAENLFMVRDGKLITPMVSSDLLEGITRRSVMQLAKAECKTDTLERSIRRTELYVADELFLCGTGAQITPVIEVDRRPVGNGKIGPLTQKLQALYFQAVRGKLPKYRHWLTEVKP